MSSLRVLPFLFTVALTAPAADFAPKLQWVAFPGINQAAVAGVGTDGKGNLYIVGTTSSRSLPVTAGAQTPGGAPVSRIDLSSGATTKLPLPSLGTIRAAASSVSNPGVVY